MRKMYIVAIRQPLSISVMLYGSGVLMDTTEAPLCPMF